MIKLEIGVEIMRLEQLQYLLDIVETHSITNTAQRFFVTQQAVSSSLKQLENEMGAQLLNRCPSGVTLTKQGELAVGFAKRVMADFEQTREAIFCLEEDNLEQHSFCIRIGSASVMNNIVMPKVLNVMAKRKKNWLTNIQEVAPDALLQGIMEGVYDIGLVSINATYLEEKLSAAKNKPLCCKILQKDNLVACMSAKSHYAKQEYITVEQIQTRDKTVYGIISMAQHRKASVEDSLISSNDIAFHKKMLLQNNIFTIMQQFAYDHIFKGKKFIARPLELQESVVIWHCLLYREDANEAVHDFIALFEECFRQV